MTTYISNVKLSLNFSNPAMIDELRVQVMQEMARLDDKFVQIHNTSNTEYVDVNLLHEANSYEEACAHTLTSVYDVLSPISMKYSINGYTLVEHQFRCREYEFQYNSEEQ